MKPIALPLCLLSFATLRGQEAEKPQKDLPAYQQEFLNLPQEKRDEFQKKVAEAQRLFAQKRVFETIDKANEAMAIFKNSPDLMNLQGACQVEFRNFDRAMEFFKEADKLAPNQPEIIFNMAELNFVTKDWEAAETNLTKVVEMAGKNPPAAHFQLSRLVEFKLVLTKLKLGKKDEAAKLAKKYDYLDDSPFPYYAEAAILFADNRTTEAEAAVARAVRIFRNPAVLSAWQDTMMEFGYIKGFFGGDLESTE